MSMPPNKVAASAEEVTVPDAAGRMRKPYTKPVLEPLGDIRDMTMGSSLGAGESGGMMAKKL